MSSAVPFLLGLLVTAGLLVPALLRLRSALAASAERERAGARGMQLELDRLTRDIDFLTGFTSDFPRLAAELYSGPKERQIPQLLIQLVVRSLGPTHAVVLVKRRPGSGGSDDLVVAAVTDGGPVEAGDSLPAQKGRLRFVAESQQVMSSADFEREATISGERLESELPGLELELMAPVVHGQETLGVIAASAPQRTSGDARPALRLIAQTGAQSLHTAAAYSRMRVSAETDGLTRVYNKRHVTRALADLVYKTACLAYDRRQSGDASPPALSVFLFDIDHFKAYNDGNGHVAGDRLLQELAGLVERRIRRDDIFGRFGGEEFLLVMPDTAREQALAAANKLREAIARQEFPFFDTQPLGHLSISGGVASYPSNGSDAEALIRAADAALYEAKGSGRNRVLAAMGEYRSEPGPPPVGREPSPG